MPLLMLRGLCQVRVCAYSIAISISYLFVLVVTDVCHAAYIIRTVPTTQALRNGQSFAFTQTSMSTSNRNPHHARGAVGRGRHDPAPLATRGVISCRHHPSPGFPGANSRALAWNSQTVGPRTYPTRTCIVQQPTRMQAGTSKRSKASTSVATKSQCKRAHGVRTMARGRTSAACCCGTSPSGIFSSPVAVSVIIFAVRSTQLRRKSRSCRHQALGRAHCSR